MLHLLKRHPIAMKAFFRHSLVLTYALPIDFLEKSLAPGLVLDTHGSYGFLAVALVQSQSLRPSFLPAWLGGSFFLSGYRLFVRFRGQARSLRGLQILRSDSDRLWMVNAGNLFTHYRYRWCKAEVNERPGKVEWQIHTADAEANLRVIAYIDEAPAGLPEGSPFRGLREAGRFAGPLPYTFDYEAETHSLIRVRGIRRNWHPKQVRVEVLENSFLTGKLFSQTTPILASAFHLYGVPYRWERGRRCFTWTK